MQCMALERFMVADQIFHDEHYPYLETMQEEATQMVDAKMRELGYSPEMYHDYITSPEAVEEPRTACRLALSCSSTADLPNVFDDGDDEMEYGTYWRSHPTKKST